MCRLKEKESEVKVEKALNDRLQQTIDNQALQISKLKLEVESLQGKLDAANSRLEALQNKRTSAIVIPASGETVENHGAFPMSPPTPPLPDAEKMAARAKRSASPSPPPIQPLSLTSDGDLRPVSALSEEDIRIHENGVSEDDEAFEKSVPSPVAPCPYIDFVPLGKEKENGSSGAENAPPVGKEKGGGVSEGVKREEPEKEKEKEPVVESKDREEEDATVTAEEKTLPDKVDGSNDKDDSEGQ